MREPRAHERDGKLPLHHHVQRSDQGFHLRGREELHLVEEEHHANPGLLSRLAQRDKHVGQVVAEIAAVGHTRDRIHIEACRHGTVRRHRDREGPEDAGRPSGTLSPPFLRGQLQQRAAAQHRHPRSERPALRDLAVGRHPSGEASPLFEGAQEHGLAHASQSGDEHRLLGSAGLESMQEDVEGFDHPVAPDQRRGSGARVRGVGVRSRIHARSLRNLPRFIKSR